MRICNRSGQGIGRRSFCTVDHLSVDLGRCQLRMAEQFLDDSDIGPALKQGSGERVAHKVRVDVPGYPGRHCRPVYRLPDIGVSPAGGAVNPRQSGQLEIWNMEYGDNYYDS